MAVRPWIDVASSAAKYLAKPEIEKITVFVGAGGSLSSGGPTTKTVEDALYSDYEYTFEKLEELREELHTLPDDQVEGCIRPLLEKVDPHIGYLSMAALANSVRVLVVNLNWDSALETACERLDVKHAAAVLDDGVDTIRDYLNNPEYRMVNLHLHGRFGHSDIRFGRRHTLGFREDEEALIWDEFFSNPTVVVGASLQGEYDITRLLEEASRKVTGKRAPFWIFSRQAERTTLPEDSVVVDLLGRHKSKRNFAGDPYVDFDRLMVEILEKRSKRSLNHGFEGSGLAEPPKAKLVLPAAKLLKGHLEGPKPDRFLAWVGERHVGKSTTARLVAHWSLLRSGSRGQVDAHFRTVDCEKAAKRLCQQTDSDPADFVIFDDPFGRGGHYEPNREFVNALLDLMGRADAPKVMITSCPSNWRSAIRDHPELGDAGETVTASPTGWYRGLELAALADDPASRFPAMVTRRVLEGVASTPARVASANARKGGEEEDDEAIEEKLALLRDLSHEERQFLALVRFYELSSSVAPQLELIAHFQETRTSNPAGDARYMLERFELDGNSFWRFAHYTDRAAFDRLYDEEQDRLLPEVLSYAYGQDVKRSVCSVWSAVARLRVGDLEPARELNTKARREWGPLLLEEAANSHRARARLPEVLELLSETEAHDFWSLRELVYEVVRLWPELHESPTAQEFLADVLRDGDRMGRYCVLESLLYFQDTTHSETWERDERLAELWEKVTAERWEIIKNVNDHEFELALIFDAIAWYRPPIPRETLLRWTKLLLRAADESDDLKGAFALTSLYHPDGRELYAEVYGGTPLDYIANLTEAQVGQAAAMVHWHYVHQSRARALLARRRLEPSNPDYLRRTEQERALPAKEADRVHEFVDKMASVKEHAGWAVHLGMNLYWTAGTFDTSFLGRCVESVPDEDDGLVTATITYGIPSGALNEVKSYFRRPCNRAALLKRMRDGCRIGHPVESVGTHVAPPRFDAGRNPHEIHRQLETEWNGMLKQLALNPSSERDFSPRVHTILREAHQKGFVDLDSMWELSRRVRAGDHSSLDVKRSRAPEDEQLANWLRHQDEFNRVVVMAALDLADETLV